jgi:hypothetical protein
MALDNRGALDIGLTLELDAQSMLTSLELFRQLLAAELGEAARDIGPMVQERIKARIEEDDIVNEGHLLNSITYATELAESVLRVLVGTNVPYAVYQEYGTVPHFVPFGDIPSGGDGKSLYNQAKHEWGWVDPPGRTAYEKDDRGRVWLCPEPDAKPTWGVFVSGRAQPFVFPGWQESVELIEARLRLACSKAAERLRGDSP